MLILRKFLSSEHVVVNFSKWTLNDILMGVNHYLVGSVIDFPGDLVSISHFSSFHCIYASQFMIILLSLKFLIIRTFISLVCCVN